MSTDGWMNKEGVAHVYSGVFSSVLSHAWFFVITWTATHQASLSINNSESLLKLKVSDAIQPSHPLSSPSPSAFNLSQYQGFFLNESVLRIRWAKYWNFSFSPSNEYSSLASFRMDWFELLSVQGILKCLLRHHSSKASLLRRSVQLSDPYMTTGKIIALTRQTFVGNVMSLLFNILSRLVIGYISRSKCLLISWLQSSSAVILESPKIKSLTVSPSICMKWWDKMPWSLFPECWVLSQCFHSPLSPS